MVQIFQGGLLFQSPGSRICNANISEHLIILCKTVYNTINNNSNIRNFLKHIFGISDFLSLCINKNLDYFFSILDNSPEDSLELLINDINSTYTNFFDLLIRENSKDKAKKYLFKELRIIKQKISLLVATNDLGKTWSLTKVIENLSYLADNLIRVAVNCLLLESNSNGDIRSNNLQNPSKNSSYFILALGKFSDICSHMCEPIKPAAPVIKNDFIDIF